MLTQTCGECSRRGQSEFVTLATRSLDRRFAPYKPRSQTRASMLTQTCGECSRRGQLDIDFKVISTEA
ncbi:MAG: hypothetical protein HFE33_06400 [Clostridia bacterium]|nr:hypothetical protein [Clostridia bacterium]